MPSLTLPDGRQLDYQVDGPEGAPLVILQHGTPSTGTLWGPVLHAARPAGVRLAAASRPGYGGSTPRPGRSVADGAADIAALADHLGAERWATAGWSGGGPHALTTAAALPERCAAAAIIAGVAPADAAGLDWLAGMGQDNLDEFGAAFAGEAVLSDFLRPAAAELATVTADELSGALASLLPPADLAALRAGLGEEVAADMRDAVSGGIDGWRDDDLAFVRPWGADLGAITVPVALWQGSEDLMVPLGHGRWLAAAVPGAEAHLVDGEGHLSILVRCAAEIVAWLAGHLRRPGG